MLTRIYALFQIEECLVCSERTARALFKPCGHMVACESKFSVQDFLLSELCRTIQVQMKVCENFGFINGVANFN